jgi:hypothetical protein
MFPSPLPQLLRCNCYTMLEQLLLLYISRNVRGFKHISRICGEKFSKKNSVKGHNSKSTNRKILTLCTSRHHHLALCQVSSKTIYKCRRSCGFRHTHKLLTNQDKHPKNFGSLIMVPIDSLTPQM